MKYITFFVLLISSISMFSQVSWNAKAGINMSKVTNQSNSDMKVGYQFGAGMDYYFNKHWGVQSSLLLITKGYKRDYSLILKEEKVNYSANDNRVYLELPISLAYKFSISEDFKLVINGGGYISYGIAGKYINNVKGYPESRIKENTFSSGTEKFDAGLTAGSTLEYLDKYTLGLIVDMGLKDSMGNSKNRTYGVNLGYTF